LKVSVIGAAGRMGGWFTGYFQEKKMDVLAFDIDKKNLERISFRHNVRYSTDIISAVSDADIILVAVSMSATSKVVLESIKNAKKGAIIIEISSFKSDITKQLKKNLRRGIRILSLHPMYGPGANFLKGQKIIVIPIKNASDEVLLTTKIFPEANVILCKAKEHDDTMAAVLSLIYFINFIFAASIPWEKIDRIRTLSGTSFNLQLTLVESILESDPDFLTSMQLENKYFQKYVKKFIRQTKVISKAIILKNRPATKSFIEELIRNVKRDELHDRAYRKMYEITDILSEE